MKTLYALLLAVLLLSACSPAATPEAGAIETAVAATMAAQQAAATPIPPTATIKPTQAIPPTATSVPPTEAPAAGPGELYSWNNLASQESGGLTIDIARVVIGDKAAVPIDLTNGGNITILDDRPVVAEIIFKVTNNSDKTISIYPDQGTVVAGNEQVDLLDFAWGGTEFGDSFSGDIYPGVTVIGGMWLGFKRTAVEDIQKMQIFFDGPFDENLNTLGPDFKFDIDLSERMNEPIPDELK